MAEPAAARPWPPAPLDAGWSVTLPDGRVVCVARTPAEVARAGATLVADVLAAAVAERGRAALALAGGSTPRLLYERLATVHGDGVPWSRTTVVFGDERCVPPDDPASNYRQAREALLAHVPVDPARVHRVRGELPPADAADDYDRTLRVALGHGGTGSVPDGRPASALDAPVLDVTLLGMGADGHTASLFPGSPALDERARWAVAVPPPTTARPAVARVTLTPGVLAASRLVLVLVTGADKAAMVRAALDASAADPVPAARVRARELTCWLLDAAAAAAVPEVWPA